MFKSKADVDKHVGRILNRLKSQTEINRECLKIARFYFDINEYESAKVYLVNYLSDNTQDAVAWELMGDLSELNEKNWSKAIDNYTECLKLSETQNKKVLLKICKCYLNLDEKKLIESIKTARKWLEKTEIHFPFDKTVVELKEKLINHLIESISAASASVTSSPNTNVTASTSRECSFLKDEWESFLLKALEQSPTDRNLNLKLIKAYLSFKQSGACVTSNTYLLKAIKKLLANELNCTFNENNMPGSLQYYQTLLEVIQTEQEKSEYGYLDVIALFLLKQSILLNLKSDCGPETQLLLLNLFKKYAKSVSELEAYLKSSRQVTAPNDELFKFVLEEAKSFVFYLAGLLLLWQSEPKEEEERLLKRVFKGSESDDLPDESGEEKGLTNANKELLIQSNHMLASICFIVSFNKYKPSSESYSRIEHYISETTKQQPDLASIGSIMLKCVNRDSAWRYSVISHWLKFKLRDNKDKLGFFNILCELSSKEAAVKKLIYQKLALFDSDQKNEKLIHSSIVNNLNEFKLSKNQLMNFDTSTIYSIIDQKALEYSNKTLMANQSSNLAYMVWFTISNAVQKHSNLISNMNKSTKNTLIFPYFFLNHGLKSSKKIQYGVENLNLCNTESLSLIDMKLFMYSCALQASSYLGDDLMPYWIQSNLCNSYQFNWWFKAVNYLLKPFATKRSEQQPSLNKLIELVRLKSNAIQLNDFETADLDAEVATTSTKPAGKPENYKQNLIITIKLALYLQYLINSLTNKFKSTKVKYNQNSEEGSDAPYEFMSGTILAESASDDASDDALLLDSLINNESEQEYSPQQKLDYLKRYQLQYWTFVCKELIKLKQIRGACSDIDSNEEKDAAVELEEALFTLSEYEFDNDNATAGHQKARNYFNYSFKHFNEPSNRHLVQVNENLLIQTGLLELVLDNITKIQGDLTEDSFDQDFLELKTNLENALTRFESIDVNLSDTDLNYYQLQLCKKIGEDSVKQRDKYIKLIEIAKTPESPRFYCYSELLNKLNCLIEYLKKKFNKNFVNKKAQICNEFNDQATILSKFEVLKNFGENDAHALSNVSISEWLKQNDPLSQLEDFEEMNKEKAELKQVKEMHEPVEEKEFAEPKSPSFSELRTPIRPEELVPVRYVQEAENAFDDVDLDKHLPPKKIDFELEVKPEPPKSVFVPEKTPPIEAAAIDTAADVERTKTIAEIKEKNDKISLLIKTLASERSEQRFRFSKDILKEQYVTVNFQYAQMNQEIKSLGEICSNRRKILADFRETVDSMNVLYDIEAFNQQFNIYFWLFQNQPNYIEEFMKTQYAKAQQTQKTTSFPSSVDNTPKKADNSIGESFSRSNTLESNKTLGTSFNASQSILAEPNPLSEMPKVVAQKESIASNQSLQNQSQGRMDKSSVLNQTDQSYSLNENYGTPQQTHTSIASFSNPTNKSTADAAATAAAAANNSPQSNSQIYLNKPIGELNFKPNENDSNLIEQMKNSINLYKLDKQANEDMENEYILDMNEMGDYNVEDEYQNEYDDCDVIVAGNLRRSDAFYGQEDPEDQDGTFLSCSNNNTNKQSESNQLSHGLSKSASGSNSKSSISELHILFQQTCQVFDCNFGANQPSQGFSEKDFKWTLRGKCTVQIISDEISDRDNFQAYMFITEPQDGKTVQYDLHHDVLMEKFNGQGAQLTCFLYNSNSLNELKTKTIAFEFENASIMNEFESSVAELKTKLKQVKGQLQPSASAESTIIANHVSTIRKKSPAANQSETSPLSQLLSLTQSL